MFNEPAPGAGQENVFGLEVMQDRGGFAWRPDPGDPWAAISAEGGLSSRFVRTVA